MKSFIFKSFSGIWHPSESSGHPRAKSGKVGHAWAGLGMNTQKCHTRLLPSMDVYLHAKSQSEISTPLSDWPRAFSAITRERDFSRTCGFRRKLEDIMFFHFKQKKVHINGLDFRQNAKNLVFQHKCCKISILRFFFENPAPLRFVV